MPMPIMVNARNRREHSALIGSMHLDRKAVFVDWLGWDIPHDAAGEADTFDTADAEYLIVEDAAGRHLGSVRLLRTDRPHLLDQVFADLCDDQVPAGPDVREITRLCVSPRCPSEDRREVSRTLMTALVDHALLTGISTYTAVTDVAFLARVLAAGWSCRPLGLPRPYGNSQLCALRIEIDAGTPQLLKQAGTYRAAPIRYPEPLAA